MTAAGGAGAIAGCPCGQVHHLGQDRLAVLHGATGGLPPGIRVQTPAGAWVVPRLYIAMHGLAATDVPALAAKYGWHRATG
ncbi:MAG TPA: hypothetical protein VK586_02510 [Streptosporangiaceae bacterium]|nr:hypothetical protein [Streptosporangiaceae bacterium]